MGNTAERQARDVNANWNEESSEQRERELLSPAAWETMATKESLPQQGNYLILNDYNYLTLAAFIVQARTNLIIITIQTRI